MLNRFRNSQPYVIFIIGLVSVILWVPVFIKSDYFWIPPDYLYSPILNMIHYSGPSLVFVSFLMGLLCFLFIGFILTDLNTRYLFLEKRNYLPSLFFILSGILVPGVQQFSPPLFALIFVLLAINRLFRNYDDPEKLSPLFDAGILLSIASMIYLPYAAFMLILWIGVFIFRIITSRNWLGSLFGFLIPWVILYEIVFFMDGTIQILNRTLMQWTLIPRSFSDFSTNEVIFYAVLLIVFLISSYHLTLNISSKKVKPKRQFYFFFWMFLINVGVYIGLQNEPSFFIAVTIPLSYLFSHYFTFVKSNIFNNVLFGLFLFSMIILQYIPLFLT